MTQSKSAQQQNTTGRKNNRATLQTRLVRFMLLIALIPLIFTSYRNIIQTRQALINGAEISLRSGATQTANSLDAFIEETLNSVQTEAQFADFSTYLEMDPSLRAGSPDQAHATDLLNKLARKDTEYIISYALIDASGNVLLDTAASVSQANESREAYFPQVRFSERPFVTAVTYANDTTTIIHFASKVLNENGNYVGILRIKYNSAILQSVITESIGPSSDAAVLLLDQLNIRMADTRYPDLVLKSIIPLELPDYLLAVDTKRFSNLPREEQATNYTDFDLALDSASTQPFFRAEISPDTPGDDSIAVAFLETQPWTVAYSRPTSIFLADVQRQINTNILFVILTILAVAILATLIARTFTSPIIALAKVADTISQGDFNARAKVGTSDEIGSLASAFNSMTDQLQSTLLGLEERIHERTADLQKNTLQLETIADVAREIAIIRDMSTLLNVSANLIRERLKYYHVGIFLVDQSGEYAILRAASSVGAEEMLAINYKLKVGQKGLIGSVTKTGQAHIALDFDTDSVHFENPYLPETRSEITLPLRSRSLTIGALDIQANIVNAFGERDIQTLQILADQLSAAIENAQLAQQVEVTMRELTNANRMQTKQAWQSTVNKKDFLGFEYDGLQVSPVPHNLPIDLLKKLESGKPIVVKQDNKQPGDDGEQNTLMVPLMLLNQVIGVIGLEQEDPDHIWTVEEIAIAQAAANRAALTLENSRLLEESQQRATREQAISQISAKIGAGTEIEAILKTAIRELGAQIGGAQITVEIGSDDE
ncbi:MAG: GAF domain-containing protein [Chloroflexi bacterium]|nr:GAF domain-containing protein [Chloroflexota bacterium]